MSSGPSELFSHFAALCGVLRVSKPDMLYLSLGSQAT